MSLTIRDNSPLCFQDLLFRLSFYSAQNLPRLCDSFGILIDRHFRFGKGDWYSRFRVFHLSFELLKKFRLFHVEAIIRPNNAVDQLHESHVGISFPVCFEHIQDFVNSLRISQNSFLSWRKTEDSNPTRLPEPSVFKTASARLSDSSSVIFNVVEEGGGPDPQTLVGSTCFRNKDGSPVHFTLHG